MVCEDCPCRNYDWEIRNRLGLCEDCGHNKIRHACELLSRRPLTAFDSLQVDSELEFMLNLVADGKF